MATTNIIEKENLPTDFESLHKAASLLIAQKGLIEKENSFLVEQKELLVSLNESLSKQLKSVSDELNALKEQLLILKAKRYGTSSEKLDKKIDDLELCIEEQEVLQSTKENELEEGKERNRPKRLKLAESLVREDVVTAAPIKCPSCGGESFRKISSDISETLEYVPSSFKVMRHIRPRCACVSCEQIVQAPAPGNTIDKGKAGPGLLAHIMIQKYANHLPLYRQSQIYEREGVEIARSTMTGWAGGCSKLLKPLIEELQKSIFASSHLHSDDTPVKVLAPGLGKTKTGRMWVYVRDGRPCGDKTPPAVCYFYSPDRTGARPLAHLKNFRGILHADAYSGYNGVYNEKVSEAACWAHFRRKFYEVTVVSNNANIAIEVLEEIGKIYKIEEEIRGKQPEERLRIRRERSKELVESLFLKMKEKLGKLPQKSMTGKAINYGLNNQAALLRFLEDGKIEIDNNAAERALRSVAIGRKNWLFAGSDIGGETAAVFYSLIETAKLNNINPWRYLRQIFANIQDYNSKKIADLLPWNIKLE